MERVWTFQITQGRTFLLAFGQIGKKQANWILLTLKYMAGGYDLTWSIRKQSGFGEKQEQQK